MSFFASSLSLRMICLISAKKDKNIDISSRKESDRASTMELAYEYVETVKKNQPPQCLGSPMTRQPK